MLTSTIILSGVWKGGLSADKFRWVLSTFCMHEYLLFSLTWLTKIYFLPCPPPTTPFSPLLRAPTDRVWVGEQLFSEDVPVPVCKFEQLHILHRFLSRKVGWLPWTLSVYSELNERLWKDVLFQSVMSSTKTPSLSLLTVLFFGPHLSVFP